MWTVHQVDPHERATGGLDTLGARVLASSADVLVAHDDATAAQVHRLPGGPRQVTVVPHGSYIGVYPAGHTRQEMREELGIPRMHSRSSRSASSAATSPSISCSRRFGRLAFRRGSGYRREREGSQRRRCDSQRRCSRSTHPFQVGLRARRRCGRAVRCMRCGRVRAHGRRDVWIADPRVVDGVAGHRRRCARLPRARRRRAGRLAVRAR